MLYSATTGSFYVRGIHRDIPEDVQPITNARHRELLAAQAGGREIIADARGRPTRARLPSLDERRAAAVAGIKREAASRIDSAAPIWRQLNDAALMSAAAFDEAARGSALFLEALARRSAIDAIRAASDVIEVSIAGLRAQALDAFDPAEDPRWPQEGSA